MLGSVNFAAHFEKTLFQKTNHRSKNFMLGCQPHQSIFPVKIYLAHLEIHRFEFPMEYSQNVNKPIKKHKPVYHKHTRGC